MAVMKEVDGTGRIVFDLCRFLIEWRNERMSTNQERILQKYGDGTKENRRAEKSRSSSLEFYYTKKHLDQYITKDSRVLEVGCATGYYGMHYANQCREYVGIDIVPSHIPIFSVVLW